MKKRILSSVLACFMLVQMFGGQIALATDTEETTPTETETTETETVPIETEISESTEMVTETSESAETSETFAETVETSESTEISESTETSVETEETSAETEVTESEPAETSESAVIFNQSVTVDDTIITLSADEGVFPEGAELSAYLCDTPVLNADHTGTEVAVTKTFDISVFLDGTEIQPDLTYGSVNVSFNDALISDENLDVTVYHESESVDASSDGDTVQFEAESFSLYTIEFTYESKSFDMTLGETKSLSEILNSLGFTGTVESVSVSNPSYFNLSEDSITATTAFSSTETLFVTIDGVDYEISITCSEYVPQTATAGTDLYVFIYNGTTMVFQKTGMPDSSLGNVTYGSAVSATGRPWSSYSSSIETVIFKDYVVGITSLSYWFQNFTSLTKIEHFERLDTSAVASVNYMFQNTSPTIEGLESFNAGSLTTMAYMFCRSNFHTLNFAKNWDVSKVTSLNYAFTNMSGLISLDGIANWNPVSCTDFSYAFSSNTALLDADLNWNTPAALYMNNMFAGDTALESFAGSGNNNCPNLRTTASMFAQCTSLTTVSGLNSWTTSSLTNMSFMFWQDKKLASVSYLGSWDVSKVTTMYRMLDMCTIADSNARNGSQVSDSVALDISGLASWNTASLTNASYIFRSTGISDISALSGWNMSNATFDQAFAFTDITSTESLSSWTISPTMTSFYRLFYHCEQLSDLSGLADWDTSHVTTMEASFYGDSHISNLDALSDWDTSSLTSVQDMFSHCTRLRDARGIGNWTTPVIVDCSSLFSYDEQLLYASFKNWDMSRLGAANSRQTMVFESCPSVVELTIPASFTISTFDVSYYDRYQSDTATHSFAGDWYHIESDTVVDLIGDNILANVTSETAGTYLRNYNLTFYPMGGTVAPRQIQVNLFGTAEDVVFPTPVREGYTFLGWFDANGVEYTSIPAGAHITKLFAHWTAGSYTLVLDPNSRQLDAVTEEVNVGYNYYLSDTVFGEFDDKYISSWNTKPDGTGRSYPANGALYNVADIGETFTLYAIWKTLNDDGAVTVHVHYRDIGTGEDISVEDVDIPIGMSFYSIGFTPSVENNTVLYTSLAGDLDEAHFDGTGCMYETDSIYNYTYPDGTPYSYSFNTLSEERAQVISSNRTWEVEDDDTDIYAYCFPHTCIQVNFPEQLQEQLSEEVRIIHNGTEYRNGELYVYVKPSGFYTYSTTTPYTATYYTHACYTSYSPSGSDGGGLRNALTDVTFSNPTFVLNSYSQFSDDPEDSFTLSSQTNNGITYYSCGSKYVYEPINIYYDHTTPETCYRVAIIPGYRVTALYQNSEQGSYTNTYSTLYTLNPESPDITEFYLTSFTTPTVMDGDKIFDGFYTEPTDGNLVIDSSGTGVGPLNLAENNTIYGHWIDFDPEEIFMDGTHLACRLIVHNDNGTPVVRSYTVYYQRELNSTYNISEVRNLIENGPANTNPSLFFGGWFTEPNGQGEQILPSYIPNGTVEIYAYWTNNYSSVYFDPYGTGAHPTDITGPLLVAENNIYFTGATTDTLAHYNFLEGEEAVSSIIPVVFSDELYNFVGWFDDDGNQLVPGTILTDETVWHAKWESCVLNPEYADIRYTCTIGWTANSSDFLQSNSTNPTFNVSFNMNASETTVLPAYSTVIVARSTSNTTGISFKVGSGQTSWWQSGGYYSYASSLPNQALRPYFDMGYRCMLFNKTDLSGGIGINSTGNSSSLYNNGTVEVDVYMDVDLDGEVDIHIHKPLYFERIPNATASSYATPYLEGTAYLSWPTSALGTAPADADDYFYVRWLVRNNSNTYDRNVTFKGLNFVSASDNGEVLASQNIIYGDRTFDGETSIWVRYPRAQFDNDRNRALLSVTASYTRQATGIAERTVTLNGDLTVRWSDTPDPVGNFEFNMGRGRSAGSTVNRVQPWQDSLVDGTQSVGPMYYWFRHSRGITEGDTRVYRVGPGDFFYNSGAPDDYNMIEPSTGTVVLDESEYHISFVQYQITDYWSYVDDTTGSERIVQTGRSTPVELWIRHRGQSDMVLYGTGASSNTFNLPYTDVVEVQLRAYADDAGWQSMTWYAGVHIDNSARVQSLCNDDMIQQVSSVFKIDTEIGHLDDNGDYAIDYDMYALYSPSIYTFDGDCGLTIYEFTNGRLGNRSLLVGLRSHNGNNPTNIGRTEQTYEYTAYMYNRSSGAKDWVPFDDGVFYFLAPANTTVNIARVYAGRTAAPTSDLGTGNYLTNVRVTYNIPYELNIVRDWNGSGRDMYIVNYNDLCHGNYQDSENLPNIVLMDVNVTKSNYDILYGLEYSCDPCILGINTSDDRPLYSALNGDPTKSWIMSAGFEQILEDYGNYMDSAATSRAYNQFSPTATAEYGFNQLVANSTRHYLTSTTVYPNEEMSYYLTYAKTGDYDIDDLTFRTTLDGESTWLRSQLPNLVGHNASGEAVTVVPDVWYCLNPNPDFENIDEEHGWTQDEPTGLTAYGVYINYASPDEAVVFDESLTVDIVFFERNLNHASDVVLTSQTEQTCRVYDMTGNVEEVAQIAANSSATVVIPDLEYSIASEPESGSELRPRTVEPEDSIVYTNTIINHEGRTISDVIVENTLPLGVSYDLSTIKVGDTPIAESGLVTDVSLENGVLTYTIKNLTPETPFTVTVPVTVTARENLFRITDQGKITGYFGAPVEAPYESNKTYHMVFVIPDPTGLKTSLSDFLALAAAAFVGLILLKRRSVIS